MPHRCIDGGAGVDGCPVRLWFEVLGRDPTWRLAVQADVGRSFGLRAAIERDAFTRARFLDEPRTQSQSSLALPAPVPFEIKYVTNEANGRKYRGDA